MALIESACPNCGAALIAVDSRRYTCPYCGSVYRDETIGTYKSDSYVPRHAIFTTNTFRQCRIPQTNTDPSLKSFQDLFLEDQVKKESDVVLFQKLSMHGIVEYNHLNIDNLNHYKMDDPVVDLSNYERKLVIDALGMLPPNKWKSPALELKSSEIQLPFTYDSNDANLYYTFMSDNVFRFSIPEFDILCKFIRFSYIYPAIENMSETKRKIADTYNHLAKKIKSILSMEQKYVKLPYFYADPFDDLPSSNHPIDLFLYADGTIWNNLSGDRIDRFNEHFRKNLRQFLITTVNNNKHEGYDEYKVISDDRFTQELLFQKRMEESTRRDRRLLGLCQNCGGRFRKSLFSEKCENCGKKKDY